MVTWLVEFDGRTKPLDEVTSESLRAAIEPIRCHIASALVSVIDTEEFRNLKIVFWMDPGEGLKFTLRGSSFVVNQAVDLLGPTAELKPNLQ